MKIANTISYKSPHTLSSLPEECPVLLAFSGGADSSALLHLLANDSKENGYPLYVAHFHHGIRGDEADRDAEFCERMAQKYGLEFYLGSADIPALARESGNSIEAVAREKRYDFFERLMRENGIPILVTAHHAEDQVESIMLHILRGCGVAGLCGMSDCRPFAEDLYLVRPLLHAKKQDILNYCKENNVDFVTDSTNFDTSYVRNALRAEVTPKLREIQPNLCKVFARLSESAVEADDFINESAVQFLNGECEDKIPLSKFNELHPALKARVLSLVFEKLSGSTLERVHIESVIELANKAEAHSSVSLPSGFSAQIEDCALVFTNVQRQEDEPDFSVPFREGKFLAREGVIINIEKNATEKSEKSPLSLDVKCELIKQNAHFRNRHEGDTIFSGKMNKKTKKLISEKKIPLGLREKLPHLVSDNEILWIPSVAVCDRVKSDKIKDGDDFFRISIIFDNN